MKQFLLIPLACGFFCGASIAIAQPDRKSSQKTVILKEPLKDVSSPVKKAERVGEVYRLWLSVNANDCQDANFSRQPPADIERKIGGTGSFDVYGSFAINDVVRWRSPRESASNYGITRLGGTSEPLKVDPRRQGYIVNRGFQYLVTDRYTRPPTEVVYGVTHLKAYPLTSKVRLALKLYDRDEPSRQYVPQAYWSYLDTRDDLICDIKTEFDLSKLGASDGRYYWFWKGTDDNGEAVGIDLFLHVEHVRSEYESTNTGPPKPRVEPKIAGKKIPGGVRGPGPVIKSQGKKAAPVR